ncbi:MAG: PD40 domain-containing protein, partial [Planctomycetes bacterium]|nr:PD40 domain-containing protein [Planctomycetota bacterium]
LTSGPFDDIEPTYMPDGRIMFCSTRCNSWVACGWYKVTTLHCCDGDGGNLRKISSNIVNEDTPWVLPDGRVLYMRWEYVDRNNLKYQHLWTTNPDGTCQTVFFGNQFDDGGVYCDAKPIPGTNRVVYVHSPGHGLPDHQGVLMTVDPRNGPDDRSLAEPLDLGLQFAALQGTCCDPYPCSQGCFLFASQRAIYLTDGKGTTEEIYRLPAAAPPRMIVQEPRLVRVRPRERVIPSKVDLQQTEGRLVLADVTYGRNMQGVGRGEIRKLLVLEQLPKPAGNMGGWHHPISMGHPYAASGDGTGNCGTFTLKRILGTVPVEPDGSAYMELPAMRNLFFVALDENDMAVKRMQSFVTLQPGEITGCVGCHEQRTSTPLPVAGLAALSRPASKIQPVADVPEVIDFPRDIQPIFQQHCVGCHDYEATPAGGPRDGGVILTGDHGPWFSHAYATLTVRRQFADGRNGGGNRPPRSIGSSASPLIDKIDGGHYEVKVSPWQRKLIRLWIETGAAYPGTYAACGSGMIDIHSHNDPTTHVWDTIMEPGVFRPRGSVNVPAPREVLDRRCGGCHGGAAPLHPQLLYNLTRPENSMVLLAPLAKSAGGYGLCKPQTETESADYPAGFAETTNPDYQAILAFLRSASQELTKVKRFDMQRFRPAPEYVRQMSTYGILSASFDLQKDPLDVYRLDQAYWRSLWHRPITSAPNPQ